MPGALPLAAAGPELLALPAGLAPHVLSQVAGGGGFDFAGLSSAQASNGVALSAEASTTASITGSPVHIAGEATTGAIAGFDSTSGGGISNVQLSTGFNSIQQNAAVMVFAAGASAEPQL
ncbi:MAG: hypothetical protein ACREE7_12230 [Dongiaceae bacterium]